MTRVNGKAPPKDPGVTLAKTIINGVAAAVSEVMQQAVARIEAAAAAETATLKPGDTLIIRISDNWAIDQARQYEEHLNARLGMPVKVVMGEQLAVLRAEDSSQAPPFVHNHAHYEPCTEACGREPSK